MTDQDKMIEKINLLKKEKDAVILAHNYQRPEIQDLADFAGDSLELSIKAAEVKESVIVFCGVRFMAESAKILSPDKKVLIPDINAGCPMADMITAKQLQELKDKHPQAKVLCYVNSSAEVKALCDMCCTSSNAAQIVEQAFTNDEEIIFVPDKCLAKNTSDKTGRKFIIWNGYCPTHMRIMPEEIVLLKEEYPQAKVMVHPECNTAVCEIADALLSTGQMSRWAAESDAKEFIVGTEEGMLHRLRKENPEKKFLLASKKAICPNMKKITLDKVLNSLETMTDEIILDEEVRLKAENSIRKMVELSKTLNK